MIQFFTLLFVYLFQPEFFFQFLLIACSNVYFQTHVCPWIAERYPRMRTYLLRPNSGAYGMPCEHCQMYWAYITFIIPYYKLNEFAAITLVLGGFVILFKLLEDKENNEEQVLIGSLVGILFGTLI